MKRICLSIHSSLWEHSGDCLRLVSLCLTVARRGERNGGVERGVGRGVVHVVEFGHLPRELPGRLLLFRRALLLPL